MHGARSLVIGHDVLLPKLPSTVPREPRARWRARFDPVPAANAPRGIALNQVRWVQQTPATPLAVVMASVIQREDFEVGHRVRFCFRSASIARAYR